MVNILSKQHSSSESFGSQNLIFFGSMYYRELSNLMHACMRLDRLMKTDEIDQYDLPKEKERKKMNVLNNHEQDRHGFE